MTTKFDYLYRRVYQRASEAYDFLQERYAKYLTLGTVWTDSSSSQFCFCVHDRVLGLSLYGTSFHRITDFRAPNSENLRFLVRFIEVFGFVRDTLRAEYSDLCDRALSISRIDLNFWLQKMVRVHYSLFGDWYAVDMPDMSTARAFACDFLEYWFEIL